MSWTDENEPTINNEPTSYEELELAFAKLQKKYEENNELLRPEQRKLDRLEETMTNTLKEEQRLPTRIIVLKTLQDIENEIKKQRAFLAPYYQRKNTNYN
ncbi:hypothetical protein NNO77_15535 [Enterococcus faecium]|nr:hypothetical protein [Enterococcus faecium]